MQVETVRLSSKGQLVIPQDVRQELEVDEGSLFALVTTKDTILLKKIQTPSKDVLIKDLMNIALEGKRRLQAKGLKESDIHLAVEKQRRK